MINQLIVLLIFIGGGLCAIDEVTIETHEGPQLLNAFVVYTQFLSFNEKFYAEKSQAAISFITQYSKVPFAQLFSSMKTADYILINILHALYSKNTNLSISLAELAKFVFKTDAYEKESDWIRQNIDFPSEKSFQVVKSLVHLDKNGIMDIPQPILEEILLIVDTAAALEAATEEGNIEVIKWILELDILYDDFETLLNIAFSDKRMDIVKVLIKKGVIEKMSQIKKTVHLISPNNETLLHLAAQSHRPAAVNVLLDAGLEINAVDNNGYTALHRAVEAEDETTVALLVRKGANVNLPTPLGDLPLHIAVSKNNLKMTKLLIKLGSYLDKKNYLGFTPLYVAENTVVAAVLRYMEDIRWEQRINESINCREYPCIKQHSSSTLNNFFFEKIYDFFSNLNMREIFCHENNIPYIISLSEIVNVFLRKGEVLRMPSHLQMLLSFKADKNEEISDIMINLGYATPDLNIKPILDSIEDINAEFMSLDENVQFKNKTGHTNLHLSAAKGDLKSVKRLVSKGAAIEALTNDSWTPLHFAASGGYEEIVKFLLKKNASINTKTSNQETPLHLASANGHTGVVKILLENDADINDEMYPDCMTSLFVASRAGHLGVVEMLVKSNASVNAKDCGIYNLTPLQVAALNGRVPVVRFLFLHGADIDARDNEGNTALFTAAWNGADEMVEILIEGGANVRLRVGKGGHTALHAAAWRGHSTAAERLLRGGAQPNSKDHNGATPLHWATTLNVAKVLLQYGASVNVKTVRGETPLHTASSHGYADIVNELLEYGADIDAKTIDGKTPAYEAILQNQYLSLQTLIENGANLYAIGPNHQTILNFGIGKGMLKLNSG